MKEDCGHLLLGHQNLCYSRITVVYEYPNCILYCFVGRQLLNVVNHRLRGTFLFRSIKEKLKNPEKTFESFPSRLLCRIKRCFVVKAIKSRLNMYFFVIPGLNSQLIGTSYFSQYAFCRFRMRLKKCICLDICCG